MKHTILFVDDNPVILKTVQLAFADEPYHLIVAESGREALGLVEREKPSVIVSDLRMPEMNGLEFLSRARKIHDNWIGMIFTAYADINAIMEAVQEEYVWRYITKPWADNRELVIAVKNAVQYLEAKEAQCHAEEIANRTKHLAGIGQLAAGIAHQFNNINVCIIGYAELAKKVENITPDLKDYLDTITQSARRATEIINDLLKFSNFSSKKFAPTKVSRVAKDALATMRKKLEEEGIAVESNFGETPRIDIDQGLIKLLITNLIDNAWQATIDGYEPKIYLETGAADDYVYVKVSDKGCGIRQSHLQKVFEPFFSTKGVYAKPNTPDATLRGVGLGLSMSHTIADNHGGKLTVDSEPGKGTTFTLELPLA